MFSLNLFRYAYLSVGDTQMNVQTLPIGKYHIWTEIGQYESSAWGGAGLSHVCKLSLDAPVNMCGNRKQRMFALVTFKLLFYAYHLPVKLMSNQSDILVQIIGVCLIFTQPFYFLNRAGCPPKKIFVHLPQRRSQAMQWIYLDWCDQNGKHLSACTHFSRSGLWREIGCGTHCYHWSQHLLWVWLTLQSSSGLLISNLFTSSWRVFLDLP